MVLVTLNESTIIHSTLQKSFCFIWHCEFAAAPSRASVLFRVLRTDEATSALGSAGGATLPAVPAVFGNTTTGR